MASQSYYGSQGGGYSQGGFPPRPAGYNNQPYNNNNSNNQRPNPPEPWYTEWDSSASTWVFINKQNGQRTHQFPRGGGYNETVTQTTSYQQQGGYGAPPPQQRQEQKQSHAGRNTALAAVGGLVAGGLLMHEGHKVGKLSNAQICSPITNLIFRRQMG